MLNKITAITDKELVIELKNGNQFAFDTLYNIYKDRIIFLLQNLSNLVKLPKIYTMMFLHKSGLIKKA